MRRRGSLPSRGAMSAKRREKILRVPRQSLRIFIFKNERVMPQETGSEGKKKTGEERKPLRMRLKAIDDS